MADYLINRPFCSDDFIRSYKIVWKAGDRPKFSIFGSPSNLSRNAIIALSFHFYPSVQQDNKGNFPLSLVFPDLLTSQILIRGRERVWSSLAPNDSLVAPFQFFFLLPFQLQVMFYFNNITCHTPLISTKQKIGFFIIWENLILNKIRKENPHIL